MKLNIKVQGNGQPMLFLHGVFGSLDNLNVLAKEFSQHYQTIQVDMRNHGLSPWSDVMDLSSMAEDIAQLCYDLHLHDIILVGHSMGGKVAMQLTQVIPQLINTIIVLDIAPIEYNDLSNIDVLKGLNSCAEQHLTDKKQIMAAMQQQGINDATILFLLKSFKNNGWLFNADVIGKQYHKLRDWNLISPWLKPILFIRGGDSDYVADNDYSEIIQQFPYAQIETVEQAGHNVHAENPKKVLQILHHWLED